MFRSPTETSRGSHQRTTRIGVRRSRCALIRFFALAAFASQQLSKLAPRGKPMVLGREWRELFAFVESARDASVALETSRGSHKKQSVLARGAFSPHGASQWSQGVSVVSAALLAAPLSCLHGFTAIRFAPFASQELSKVARRESPKVLGRELRELLVFVEASGCTKRKSLILEAPSPVALPLGVALLLREPLLA
jgi:hypothetical protein